ncbi:hypothetical protein FF38_12384 [Lucilia cuprina]|uniref:Uncharacterized protein n=1 Tax=Lucilia cuprina TaxID=7375 RepID=A0A0L0BW66_LUCCU|nr:hypothetical protein FF38_12384 [Lucilia cuprina]
MFMLRSCMCGSGYLSGTVIQLSRRKSPHGRQSFGSFFGTKCSADVAHESEGLQMPDFTRKSNSLLATLYLIGSKRLGLVNGNGPLVANLCTVECLTECIGVVSLILAILLPCSTSHMLSAKRVNSLISVKLEPVKTTFMLFVIKRDVPLHTVP